ncbi:hypothetical protein BHE74_00022763 [Ensete ventricosum]|nr:hypothetical protein BHE74_00022763 [Ensete ventricosum]
MWLKMWLKISAAFRFRNNDNAKEITAIKVRGYREFGDRGLGLERWLRVAIDGSNRFDRVRWLRKIRIKIGYDSYVLRLERCPKDYVISGSKIGRVSVGCEKKNNKRRAGEYRIKPRFNADESDPRRIQSLVLIWLRRTFGWFWTLASTCLSSTPKRAQSSTSMQPNSTTRGLHLGQVYMLPSHALWREAPRATLNLSLSTP